MSLFREEVSEYRKIRLHGEVVLSQSLSSRVMAAALILSMAIIVTWVSLGSYARIETAPGILVTQNPSSKIVAPVPGVLRELLVHEGSVVRKGDRIAVVGLDRQRSSGRGVAAGSLTALAARRELGEGQIVLSARREASERARLLAMIAAANAQAESLRGQIELQRQVVTSNRTMFDQIAKVVDRGFVSKVEMERRRQALIASEQSLASLGQQLLERSGQAESLEGQIASLSAESARAVYDIRASLQAIAQEHARLEGEEAYVITAPVSGRVTALQTVAGRMASPDRPMMIIVPEGSPLKAEIYAPSRAIGFVHVGQEARLLYEAFPYQRFGSFGARVESISRIVIDPRETDVPIKLEGPVYRVVVTLERQAVDAYGEKVPLQPGMALQANIILEREGFLDWLLKPLHAVMRKTA